MEIRGAAGGDEAALFAGDLLTMYQKYAEGQGWRFEVMEASYNGVGGIKEVVAMVSGQSVYSKLKYESGAHRVQRVPVTESQGRVHTSTATVLIMPEVEEVEYDIDKRSSCRYLPRFWCWWTERQQGCDCRAYRSLANQHQGGNAGRAYSAENREKAMKIIRARVASLCTDCPR